MSRVDNFPKGALEKHTVLKSGTYVTQFDGFKLHHPRLLQARDKCCPSTEKCFLPANWRNTRWARFDLTSPASCGALINIWFLISSWLILVGLGQPKGRMWPGGSKMPRSGICCPVTDISCPPPPHLQSREIAWTSDLFPSCFYPQLILSLKYANYKLTNSVLWP